ncbi:MAG: outer membrane beta-barrel protein [Steroidobacterales bacterium]|jgi:hypothetical protein
MQHRTTMPAALAAAALLGHAARAEEPATPAAPSLAEVLASSGISVTGYVDLSYEYLSGLGSFASGTADRVFDARHDSFTLHQAALTLARQPKEGFGVLVNLTAGQDAPIIKSYPNTGGSEFDVTQAYVQYATGPLTLVGGKFVTLAGAETINPTTDTNFSRSILFGYAIPFTHTGLRASYALSEQLSVTLGLNNGWDQVSDANSQKTLEYGMTFTPAKTLSLTVDGYLGREPVGIVNNTPTAAGGQRALADVVASWSVSDKITLVGNFDYGEQKDDSAGAAISKYRWDGAALYLNYAITEQWSASLRGEFFDDKDGYRTGVLDGAGRGQKWRELTLTVACAPTKNMLLRFEARYDRSGVADAFVESADGGGGALRFNDQQSSIAVEALYRF